MTSGVRTGLGVALLAFGLLLGLVGGLIAWHAAQRWLAVDEVREAQSLIIHAGRLDEARRVAAGAVVRMPDEAVPALLAADLGDPDSAERLASLAARAGKGSDRQALLAAAAMARALAGKPTEIDLENTGDGRMIAAIVAARSGRPVGKLAVGDEDPPHLAIERAALIVLTRRAWEDGRAEDVRRYAGALVMLDPRAKSKEAQIATLVLAALGTERAQSVNLLRLAGDLPQEDRGRILRAVVALAPERRQLLAAQYAKELEVAP